MKTNYGGLSPITYTSYKNWKPALTHVTFQVAWATLNPAQGSYNWSTVDKVLSSLPSSVNVRLHIIGGPSAPQWLMNESGTVSVYNSRSASTVECGRYWNQVYIDAWHTFCQMLGAKYDANPRISGVNLAACSMRFDEPFILGSDAPSVLRMFQAGLTKTTMSQAILYGMSALTSSFPTTICEMPVHSAWAYPDSTGKQKSDWPAGRDLMNTLHDLYGQHWITTDYGLGPTDYTDPQPRTTATDVYGWMHQRAIEGYPVAWQLTAAAPGQTPTSAQIAGCLDAIVKMKGRWAEHSAWGQLTNTQVQKYNTAILANVTPKKAARG